MHYLFRNSCKDTNNHGDNQCICRRINKIYDCGAYFATSTRNIILFVCTLKRCVWSLFSSRLEASFILFPASFLFECDGVTEENQLSYENVLKK